MGRRTTRPVAEGLRFLCPLCVWEKGGERGGGQGVGFIVGMGRELNFKINCLQLLLTGAGAGRRVFFAHSLIGVRRRFTSRETIVKRDCGVWLQQPGRAKKNPVTAGTLHRTGGCKCLRLRLPGRAVRASCLSRDSASAVRRRGRGSGVSNVTSG